MATYGPQTQAGFIQSLPRLQLDTPEKKKQYLMANGRYNEEEANAMLAGGNPMQKHPNQVSQPMQPVKAGAGMAQNGLAVHPDSLEQMRSQGVPDDVIADQMAQTSTHFGTQLQKIRKKYNADPAATTAFLNTRFYGDTTYNPVSKTTYTGGEPKKATGFMGKTLDRIYGKAQDILGPGGIMDQYNQGDITSGQAVWRGANKIAQGAMVPVTESVSAIAKGAYDNNVLGLKDALNYAGSEFANSEIGQQVIPAAKNAMEAYNNLPESSGWRDLAAGGQTALDALDVFGAEAGIGMAKRGALSTTKWSTYRHPLETGKYVLTGKAMSSAIPVVEEGGVRELTGTAKEAVKKGMDEKLMTFVAEQNPDTRAVMAKMTQAANEGSTQLGGSVAHKEILGGQMMDNLAYILDEKGNVGKALKAMKTSVSDDVIDLTDGYHDLLTNLRSKGAVINDKWQIVSLAGAADDNIPILQKALDFFSPDDTGRVVKRGVDIDRWRTKMFEEMNSVKAKLQPSAAGRSTFGFAENTVNGLRRKALIQMAKGNKNMIVLNDAYEELSTATSKFLKSIGYKGKLSPEAITSKELRAGEVALKTLGNASADTRDAFMQMLQTARKYGRVSGVDEMALVRYADALEDVFPISPTRSLRGEVSRATRDAAGNLIEDTVTSGPKAGIRRVVADRIIGAIDKMRGVTPENRLQLLLEVLNAPPETEFFTIVKKVLPTNAAKRLENASEGITAGEAAPSAKEALDEAKASAERLQQRPQPEEAPKTPGGQGKLESSSLIQPPTLPSVNGENRPLGLTGLQPEGRPGIEKPALPLEQAQMSGNGGRVPDMEVFRGESTGNRGGNYYSTDREFARQFTQSGQDAEISSARIPASKVYKQSPLPSAVDEAAMDKAIAQAKKEGYAAILVDEGKNQPNSVFVIDKSAIGQSAPVRQTQQGVMAESQIAPYAISRKGFDTVWHETSPQEAQTLIFGNGDHSGLYVSPSKDLAIGQKARGAKIEFATTQLETRGGARLDLNGNPSEFQILKASSKLTDQVKSVEFQKPLKSVYEKPYLNSGWVKEKIPNGGVKFVNPKYLPLK